MKLLIMKFSPLPCYLIPLTSKYNLFSNTLILRSSLNVSNQVSHPYKTTGKIIDLYILIFNEVYMYPTLNIFLLVLQHSHLYNGYRVFPGGKAAGAWC
jgi:hypothetical protein